jgi:hypothetical protein
LDHLISHCWLAVPYIGWFIDECRSQDSRETE